MKLYTSNYLSQSISVIDYKTLSLEKEINLGPDIYPHHFCIDREKDIIYILQEKMVQEELVIHIY